MSTRTDVLLWAQRVVARKAAAPYMILEIAAGAGVDVAQEAFHKIARLAHPDLHRTVLTADELELVTTAYARAAAAYQAIRSQRPPTARAPLAPAQQPAGVAPTIPIPSSPMSGKAVPVQDAPPGNPAQAMTSKALLYYRKAELALRRGDLTGALLQLKMAIASDPQSQLLRSALAEVEAEVKKP
ncbi:MAG: hypothetical protein ABIY55_00690 [Kofleriaceae bacterium]